VFDGLDVICLLLNLIATICKNEYGERICLYFDLYIHKPVFVTEMDCVVCNVKIDLSVYYLVEYQALKFRGQ
jgi:hypothetical protein